MAESIAAPVRLPNCCTRAMMFMWGRLAACGRVALGLSTLASLLLILAGPARAADTVLSGALEEVSNRTIWVAFSDGRRIHLRLPRKGDLAATAIAARYHLADQVQITCKRIDLVFDPDEGPLAWDLKQLQFLRSASPEELSIATAPRPWRNPDNLLKSPAPAPIPRPQDGAELARVRQVNLEYAARLPNFVADEIARRYTRPKLSQDWNPLDTIQSEISFQGEGANRDNIRVNGKPRKGPYLPRFTWGTGLGELKPLFDPDCPNTIEPAGREELHGKLLAVYRWRSPRDGCFGFFHDPQYEYNPARTGRILVDESTGRVVRSEEGSSQFPDEFGISEFAESVTWDSVKIGDASHWLPVGHDFVFSSRNGASAHAVAEFRNHRHFEAATSVTFH